MDAAFFMEKGQGLCYPTPPQRILDWLRTSDLPGRLRDMLRIMLNYRYSFAMAVCPLRVLAQEMGLKLRQTRYLLAELKKLHLVDVTERPGRASMISIAPLIRLVKEQAGWQEAEQPAPVETLAEVVAEPTEEELFWLQAADSEEDAATEAEEDVGAYLDWQRLVEHIDRRGHLSRGQRRHLDNTKGLRWEGLTLIVQARDSSQVRFLEILEATISLSVLDVFGLDYEVQFEPEKRKKPKKLGTLAALAVAAVGV